MAVAVEEVGLDSFVQRRDSQGSGPRHPPDLFNKVGFESTLKNSILNYLFIDTHQGMYGRLPHVTCV